MAMHRVTPAKRRLNSGESIFSLIALSSIAKVPGSGALSTRNCMLADNLTRHGLKGKMRAIPR
jgi:hypothetical protein